ncbi:MarR family winged helix-turn-helix transcriptional regulator [Thalassospira sp. HF15]|uniref:MarR family winged helix-turn-helix transcriptional regulator n=1 Tax=Thalassospira sp. HF15 TaxID=2722755 RepID=UPI0020CA47A0|nr:MarR family winged helix-turn-helix transcriptional regulator [Thalassospira sp. HF15]
MSLTRHRSAGYMTNWAARLFARMIDRKLKPLGLSSGNLPVFFALADGGSRTQKELALGAGIEQPTMAATLNRMDRDGLIVREKDSNDRRITHIRLSKAALARADEIKTIVDQVNETALSDLNSLERRVFMEALGKVTATLSQADDPSEP